ncbi:MAG: FKBP-type peptidyl-prolyl cis-trans isomerase [bacterium]
MCANAIKDYLAKADTKGKSGKKVEKGQNVVVHYIGRLDEETVFDTSIEEIAKACGKYNSGRNYDEGLAFQV